MWLLATLSFVLSQLISGKHPLLNWPALDQVLLIMQTESVPHEKVLQSLELFGKHVIPAFKNRSTTRPLAAAV